jgi:outer membrane protein OmpA-like peptidoglycan-associated protein
MIRPLPDTGRLLRMAAVATLATAALGLLAGTARAQVNDPKCAPHPLFTPFPNAFTDSNCRSAEFQEHAFSIKGGGQVRKGGAYLTVNYKVERDANGKFPTPIAVLRNHQNAIVAKRGEILADNPGWITARLTEGGATWWIEVRRTSGMGNDELYAYSITTVREAAMEQVVQLTPEAIAAEGKIAIYGILFDTDKAVIKPESEATLAAMTTFLRSNAALNVFIVGHTDMQGTLERNRALSRERAAAVVAALTQRGIAAARLAADGVGPLVPVASNADDTGRALNRRVEMVLR